MINEKTWCFSPETYALLRKKQTAEIDAWLDEHVAQETGYVLDDSLTLADAAAQAKATGDAIAAIVASIAPAFDSTATYAIGNLVLYDGKLYRFTADHPAGAWTGTDAEETTVGAALASLKTDVEANEASIEYLKLREEEDRQMILGSVAEVVEDSYTELRSAPIHTAITIGQNVYPRMDNTRLGMETIKGRTVAWNQIVRVSTPVTVSGIGTGTRDTTTGTITIQITSGSLGYYCSSAGNIQNHKVLVSQTVLSDTQLSLKARAESYASTTENISANTKTVVNSIISVGNFSGTAAVGGIISPVGSSTANITIENLMLIDLTLIYGTTLADSIYAMEQATPGAGVAYVRQRMPLDYYAYNAGELTAPVVSGVEVTGFNQWDEQWEKGTFGESGQKSPNNNCIRSKNYIPVLPGTTYYVKIGTSNLNVYYYDANKTFLAAVSGYKANQTFTTPSNCYYIMLRFNDPYGTTYRGDTCINLSKTTGTPQNGEYRPYQHESLSVPSTTLNGVGTAQDYIEAVEVGENDYSLIKHTLMGSVDLGTLTWGAYNASLPGSYYAEFPLMKDGTNNAIINNGWNVCAGYYEFSSSASDKVFYKNENGRLYVKDSVYDGYTKEAFKTAMSGVYLAFELATPTETTIASHLTLAEVSAIAQNGGIIGIVNSNGDIVQPDLTVDTVISKSAS